VTVKYCLIFFLPYSFVYHSIVLLPAELFFLNYIFVIYSSHRFSDWYVVWIYHVFLACYLPRPTHPLYVWSMICITGFQHSYGKGPHRLLWAGLRTVRGKMTISGGIPNCLNYCYIFIIHTQFTNVVTGHIIYNLAGRGLEKRCTSSGCFLLDQNNIPSAPFSNTKRMFFLWS
jgi:hypothetical protein